MLALALAASACAQVDIIAVRDGAGTPADAAADAAAADAAADAAPDAGPPPAMVPCPYLQQTVSAGTRSATVAQLVAGGLGRAICSCTEYVGGGELLVDSFDRAEGPFVSGEAGGDVGANLALRFDGPAQIGGSLFVAGPEGLGLAPDLEVIVGQDLEVGGPLVGAMASLQVGGDAQVGGRLELRELVVTGVLTQPMGAARNVTAGDDGIGELRTAEVVVEAPCACGANDLLDVVMLVNEAVPDATSLPVVPPPVIGSRCEQYELTDIAVDTLQIMVLESAALLVPGDLQIGGDLTIDTVDGAELDLFIGGNVNVEGRLELGTASGQGPVRIHVGGAGTINLRAGGEMQGALYAPLAELVLGGPLTLSGALIVERVAATSAALTVHYDRSLGRAPEP